jgi:hypothetical protein
MISASCISADLTFFSRIGEQQSIQEHEEAKECWGEHPWLFLLAIKILYNNLIMRQQLC